VAESRFLLHVASGGTLPRRYLVKNARLIVALSLSAIPSMALAGPDWVEGGTDAGSTVSAAQVILGTGQLRTLAGSLSEGFGRPDYEDMYLIRITDPAEFSFTLVTAQFNASMYLFNVTQANEAFGLLGNLDSSAEDFRPRLTFAATDGTGASVNNPGVYALVITSNGWRPTSGGGQIFSFGEDAGEISGPDGPGAARPHTGWTGTGTSGIYSVEIEGATFVDVPTPGVASVGLVAIVAAARRRRR
jgi:hypothetical protein